MAANGGGVSGRLTAKVGPLPVWGWAILAVGLYFGFRYLAGNSGGTSTGGTGTVYGGTSPVTSGGSVDSGTSASGLGSPVDNLSADYLEAYGQLVEGYAGIESSLLGGLLASQDSLLRSQELSGSIAQSAIDAMANQDQPDVFVNVTPAPVTVNVPAMTAGASSPSIVDLLEALGGSDPGPAQAPNTAPPPVVAASTSTVPASQAAAKAASNPKPKTTNSGGSVYTQTNAGPYGKKPLY